MIKANYRILQQISLKTSIFIRNLSINSNKKYYKIYFYIILKLSLKKRNQIFLLQFITDLD